MVAQDAYKKLVTDSVTDKARLQSGNLKLVLVFDVQFQAWKKLGAIDKFKFKVANRLL